MDPHRTGKAHVTAWVLVVVAVPVLYVLTLPVVVWAYIQANPGTYDPASLAIYGSPFEWLLSTPLRESLTAYYEWVLRYLEQL